MQLVSTAKHTETFAAGVRLDSSSNVRQQSQSQRNFQEKFRKILDSEDDPKIETTF